MAIIELLPAREPSPAALTPSPYQEDIYKAIATTEDNLIIEAVAGSGKTTTIIQALSLIPNNKRVLFVAFNKSIATALAEKVPSFVEARTLHSIGYSIIRANYSYAKSNRRKVYNHLRYHVIDMEQEEQKEFFYEHHRDICGIISGLKRRGIQEMTAEIWLSLMENPKYDLPDTAFCLAVVSQLLEDMWHFTGEKGAAVVDFDDMICYPAYIPMPTIPTYDYVFVDEAQDLDEAQHLLISKLVGDGRLIAVGDTHQAIYGFRGAAPDSMRVLKERFACRELPLSISYRCPAAVVDLAARYCPHIRPAPRAPVGIVQSVPLWEARTQYTPGSYVIGRTWAPLIAEALAMLNMGLPVWVNGREILPALNKIAKSVSKRSRLGHISQATLLDYEMHLERTESPRKRSHKVAMCEVLRSVCGSGKTVSEVGEILCSLITDRPEQGAVIFTTIHRVKGLEEDDIFILFPEDIPHRLAETAEEIQQEYNLLYVAITRAKKRLFLINKGE